MDDTLETSAQQESTAIRAPNGKRLWIEPMLSTEDANRTASGKISNPIEGIFAATPEGAAS